MQVKWIEPLKNHKDDFKCSSLLSLRAAITTYRLQVKSIMNAENGCEAHEVAGIVRNCFFWTT